MLENFPSTDVRGWKKERIVQGFYDGSRIIAVVEDDPKYALRKLDEIQQIVDDELGFQENLYNIQKRKTYLYISCDKQIVGLCVTEEISHGYRVLPDSQTSSEHSDRQRAWCCSTEKQPACCGINRIWVSRKHRGQGIATKLIDCIRRNFTLGYTLNTDDIAFSDPTPDGKLFATKYTGTKQFLVYKYNM
ncbi:N-acetyltransferase ESCO1-like [Lingula anatina]|uniref:N-acetyltransferase ESCO1-like n=1 Tax=Lingula anatina TaxID=7574 RepID=A0A1S3K7H7_LINAN|nr:N-acetyltransferase ESCO1-like [Lingula anatina]|eukprot:XP_013418399.1 N-acetyltransferase ESCO1-like [Lingula anatina]